MNEYILVRALVGVTITGAIISTGLVFLLLSGFSKKWRHIMLLQLSGAVLIAAGFSIMGMKIYSRDTVPLLLVAVGVAVMISSALRSTAINPPRSLFLRALLILASPTLPYLLGGITVTDILRAFVLLSLLILMGTLASIRMISSYMRFTLNAASWLLVFYSWIGYLSHMLPLCYSYVLLLIYYSALLLWLFGAVVMLINLRGWLGWNA